VARQSGNFICSSRLVLLLLALYVRPACRLVSPHRGYEKSAGPEVLTHEIPLSLPVYPGYVNRTLVRAPKVRGAERIASRSREISKPRSSPGRRTDAHCVHPSIMIVHMTRRDLGRIAVGTAALFNKRQARAAAAKYTGRSMASKTRWTCRGSTRCSTPRNCTTRRRCA